MNKSLEANFKDLPEPELSFNAQIVLSKRYLQKGPHGESLENVKQLFCRVASSIGEIEKQYANSPYDPYELAREFYLMMTRFDFLPNSPTLMNAGTKLAQLAACFVLPVGDSMEEIFDAVKYAALIHKSGGGTGFSFSRIRPQNSRVGSTGGVASGPLSFLKIFNTATEQVKQGGTRRGANMGVLHVDHPDIVDFIRAKERDEQLNNFNLSVAITEKFMQAVEKDEYYPLIAPHTKEEKDKLKAKEVFNLLVQKAWEGGDPGIIFIDRINRDNPTPSQGEIESTNPCGEQPLLPYEACNLGSVNLANFYSEKSEDGVDWSRLKDTVHLCVRFLDNVIDASKYPFKQISQKVYQNRKIGLGIMGWADLLYRLRIPYNSVRALELAEKVMKFIQTESKSASRKLAEERGPFPAYADSIFAEKKEGPYRNATTTTIAPTGTLSIITGCSSGIEPLYALYFVRQVLEGETLKELNPYFEQAIKESSYNSSDLMEEVKAKGTIKDLENIPQEIKNVFVTAMDIEPEWHLKMQNAFQKHIDNAVSKTLNLAHSATKDDVYRIYWQAYELGCKGVTVYREGSKREQVLSTTQNKEKDKELDEVRVRDRPEVLYGFTQKVKTGLGNLYLTVNEVESKPFEVFATIGRSGRSITAKAEAIGRLVSLALRSGISVKEIVRQLKGIGGEHPVFQKKGLLLSIPDAVAWVLENRYLHQHERPYLDVESLSEPSCPECGGKLIFQEGCFLCQICGYTKCS